MIPRAAIQAWAVDRPWPNLVAVEQDLLLARLIIEFAHHPLLGDELAFRGGTCGHQLAPPRPLRQTKTSTSSAPATPEFLEPYGGRSWSWSSPSGDGLHMETSSRRGSTSTSVLNMIPPGAISPPELLTGHKFQSNTVTEARIVGDRQEFSDLLTRECRC